MLVTTLFSISPILSFFLSFFLYNQSSMCQVNVEGRNMGDPIDFNKLDGTWRLQYTSAPDVLILFQAAANLPFFQVLSQYYLFATSFHFPCFLTILFFYFLYFYVMR